MQGVASIMEEIEKEYASFVAQYKDKSVTYSWIYGYSYFVL